MKRFLCLLLVSTSCFLLMPSRANAQRGVFVEELFRTIAEAQLEREQRKRLEAEREAREKAAAEGRPSPPVSIAPPPGARRGPSINVRSREAAEFAQRLVEFNAAVTPLAQEMRAAANRNVAVRGLLPDAYQISADTRTLLAQCDGLSSLQPIVAPYASLDANWRQLSFRLRSLDNLSQQCTNSIRAGDALISRMSRQLQIQPQFDRHQLHDLMIIAATYMQALIDDLQIARIPRADIDRLTHDCRLLRQQLLAESGNVEQARYEDVVTRFTDLVTRWNAYSERVYAINDLHLQRRLDRIAETADQTYAVLWMPPPYNANLLIASAKRLDHHCGELLSRLSIRTLSSLPRSQQIRVLESSYAMSDAVKAFANSAEQRASRSERRQQFAQIDAQWTFLRDVFYKLPSLNQATLASVDHECEFIRGALGMSAPQSARSIDHESLIEAAAALEGASEFLLIDVRRYERYLQPEDYRKSIVGAAQEFHLHAKQLYTALNQRADLATLQREADHMVDGWKQLSEDLSHLEGHGLTERRAQSLRRDRDELVPLVAKIAAALVGP